MDRTSAMTPGEAFLTSPTTCITTPEDLPVATRLMGDALEAFLRSEVVPRETALEAREPGLLRRLLEQAGNLGLLAGAIPPEYGGLGLSRSTLVRLYERAALCPSFALAHNVHIGVATLPLVWFGTEEQKSTYLPHMVAGKCIGAFALTEGNSGSDALSARCIARKVPGGFSLFGTKNWITNARIADLFVVFARIEGASGLTAFLVPRNTPGVAIGREEEKLGLRGTSTCALFLNGVFVSQDTVLGEEGAGHRVALYPLNVGRLNIAAGALGAAKESLRRAAFYARQRHQFGHTLAEFGLIQAKLGEMAARLFAAEAMVYRIAGLLDNAVHTGVLTPMDAAAEYAVECALVKIYATETQGFVVDEALQIHGGYGYSEAYPAARAFRDARVTRIFEGTNEINRLTIVDQLRRRFQSGRLPLGVGAHAASEPLTALRTVTAITFKSLWERAVEPLQEQEAAGICADLALGLFAAESAHLRALRLSGELRSWATDAADLALLGTSEVARPRLHNFCVRFGDRALWERLSPLLPEPWKDGVATRRRLSEAVCQCDGWLWG